MKNKLRIMLLSFSMLCTTLSQSQCLPKTNLSAGDKLLVASVLNQMAQDDQHYRKLLSIGTMDPVVVKQFNQVTDTMSIEQYIAYKKTLNYALTKEEKEQLWTKQHMLDLINYKKLNSIIYTYGYPSKKRVGSDIDIFAILLHPPAELDAQAYLNEMSALLMPEVKTRRMKAKSYALFYDNIKSKILNEPQLYGTNASFNVETMKAGLPQIANIKQTNKARQKIGLPSLKAGEYELVNKS